LGLCPNRFLIVEKAVEQLEERALEVTGGHEERAVELLTDEVFERLRADLKSHPFLVDGKIVEFRFKNRFVWRNVVGNFVRLHRERYDRDYVRYRLRLAGEL